MKFLLSIAIVFLAVSAWGRDHHPSRHRCHHPVVIHPCTSGYYTYRTETILVSPERVERQYVPPAYETRFTPDGRPVVVKVREGYFREVVVPAQYITRQVRVWVPGHHAYHHHHCRSGTCFNFSVGQKNWGLSFGIRR